jgi:hypothetical protein
LLNEIDSKKIERMVKRSKKVFKLLITGDYMKEELKKG